MTNNKQLLKWTLQIGWATVFAYFFGQLLWYVMPFPWPFEVIFGYAGGIVAGASLAYFVLGKIRPIATQVVAAVLMLVFVGAVNTALWGLTYRTTVMSLEIQELRDKAAQR